MQIKFFVSFALLILVSSLSGCSLQQGRVRNGENIDLVSETSSQSKKEVDLWEKKIVPKEELKIGIITDTQIHPSRLHKWQDGPEAQRYLKPRYGDAIDSFVAQMRIFQPDVIVVPGDIIEGTDDDDYVGTAGLKIVQEKIDSVGVPVVWVAGNHELRSVTKNQYMDALNIDYLNGSFEFGDYKIIVLDGNFHPNDTDVTPESDRYIRGHVAQSGIAFLEEELQTDKQTILFVHQPPFVGADISDRSPGGLLDNGDVIQKLLARYNARAAIGGHIEYKRHVQKQGTDYYALPGTIKSEMYPGAYYTAVFGGGDVDMTMYYLDSTTQEYGSFDFDDLPDGSGKKKGKIYE